MGLDGETAADLSFRGGIVIILGVDCGKDGGLCLMDRDGQIVELIRMPTIPVGKKSRKELDIMAIMERVRRADHCVIEKVGGFLGRHFDPKSGKMVTNQGGSMQMFNFGRQYGQFLGWFQMAETPYTEVTPQMWQKIMLAGMPKGKNSSIVRAQQLWPTVSLLAGPRCHKPHDGMAEAALIAEYYRTMSCGFLR